MDKGTFRSTLIVVWLPLNAVLCAQLIAAGRLTAQQAKLFGKLSDVLGRTGYHPRWKIQAPSGSGKTVLCIKLALWHIRSRLAFHQDEMAERQVGGVDAAGDRFLLLTHSDTLVAECADELEVAASGEMVVELRRRDHGDHVLRDRGRGRGRRRARLRPRVAPTDRGDTLRVASRAPATFRREGELRSGTIAPGRGPASRGARFVPRKDARGARAHRRARARHCAIAIGVICGVVVLCGGSAAALVLALGMRCRPR